MIAQRTAQLGGINLPGMAASTSLSPLLLLRLLSGDAKQRGRKQ
jgi:hypothetical protein